MRNHPKTRNQKLAACLPVHQRRVCPEMLEYKLKAVAEKKVLVKNTRICHNAALTTSQSCVYLNHAYKNMQDQNNAMKKENDELKEKNEELEEELKNLQHKQAPGFSKVFATIEICELPPPIKGSIMQESIDTCS